MKYFGDTVYHNMANNNTQTWKLEFSSFFLGGGEIVCFLILYIYWFNSKKDVS